MPLQIVGQLLGHSTLVQPRRIRRIVARHLNHTDLILHLHHDHRLLMSIMITQIRHHMTEGTLVGLQHILTQRRSLLNGFPLRSMGTRESLHVTLKPLWRIAAHRVFPSPKPQQHHLQLVAPCFAQDHVERPHVELPLLGLNQLPRHGNEHGVKTHLMEMRKCTLHILWRRG